MHPGLTNAGHQDTTRRSRPEHGCGGAGPLLVTSGDETRQRRTLPRPSFDAAPSAACPRGLGLQHTQRRGDRGVVYVADLVGRLPLTEGEQQRHRLRRAERRVERCDVRSTLRPREPLFAYRVTRSNTRPNASASTSPVRPSRAGSGRSSRRVLPRARVVLLGTARRSDVVAADPAPASPDSTRQRFLRRAGVTPSTPGASALLRSGSRREGAGASESVEREGRLVGGGGVCAAVSLVGRSGRSGARLAMEPPTPAAGAPRRPSASP